MHPAAVKYPQGGEDVDEPTTAQEVIEQLLTVCQQLDFASLSGLLSFAQELL